MEVVRYLLAALVLSACYTPSFDDCQLKCSEGACPDDLRCVAGMCRLAGTSGECSSGPNSDAGDDGPMVDAASGVWSTPVAVEIPGTGWTSPSLTADEDEMILEGSGGLYRTFEVQDVWQPPTLINAQTAAGDASPVLARTELHIYFGSNRGAGTKFEIQRFYRPMKSAPFGALSTFVELGSIQNDIGGSVTDSNTIFFTSDRASGSGFDIYKADYDGDDGRWLTPEATSELNSPLADIHPVITGDGLTIVFASNRLNTNDFDIYYSHRTDPTSVFPLPTRIPELVTSAVETDPWISNDGTVIYFVRGVGAGRKIFRSQRN